MTLDLVCVESFLVLARHANYRRAAAELYITTSALSKRIRRLEKQLGETLIVRDRGLCAGLTPSGDRFVTVAQELFHVSLAAPWLTRGEHQKADRLVVAQGGGPADNMPTSHFRVVKACIEARCNVHVSMVGIPYGADDLSLEAGKVDLVLTAVPPARAGLAEAPLRLITREVAVPRSHDFAQQGFVAMENLERERLISDELAGSRWMTPWILGDIAAAPPLVPVRAMGMAQVLDGVARGIGVAVVAPTMRHCLPPGVVTVPLVGPPPMSVRATYRRNDVRPVMRTALDVLSMLASAWQDPTGLSLDNPR